MSMHAWTEPGYGFKLWTGKNFRTVCDFIKNNDDSVVIPDDVIEEEDEFSLEEELGAPASDVVASIINEKEDYTVFRGYRACGDTEQEEMLGIEPSYPWWLSDKDKTLTKEDADAILAKYAEILGIDEAPDTFNAEYIG